MNRFFSFGAAGVLAMSMAVPSFGAIAGSVASFDVDGDGDPTQTDFASVTDSGGGVLTGTDGSVSVQILGFSDTAGRDRGTAATTPGADNNDNQVPEGEFSALYRDFYFAGNGATVTVNLSGLAANTEYIVRAYSYDSGAFAAGTPVNQDFLVSAAVVANLAYSGDLAGGAGPDPDTTTLDTYFAEFSLTTDGSGDATFTTISSGGQGARLNGLVIIPEPASIALLGLGGLMMLRRRRA